MTVHKIPLNEFIAITELQIYSSRSSTGAVSYIPDLAGQVDIDTDDLVIIQDDSTTLFKGLVVSSRHSMGSESVGPSLIDILDIIDTVPWEAKQRFYNAKDLPCFNVIPTDLTLSDFISTEFVLGSLPATWFSDVEVLSGVGDLLLPEVDTYNKGFITVLNELIAPYPHLRWMVEFSGDETIYPIGKLVIFDASVGVSSINISIGGNDGVVLDYQVSKDLNECAQFVRVNAYGNLTDRLEVVKPAWPRQSLIQRWFIGIASPEEPDDSTRVDNDQDEFFLDFQMYANNAIWEDSVTGIFGSGPFSGRRQMRLWPGADIAYNVRTGEIRFLTPEDESSDGGQWWWVNNSTGEIYPPGYFGGSGPDDPIKINLTGGIIRRPIAYNNAHIDPDTYLMAHYKTLHPSAFTEYTTQHPIADLRLNYSYVDKGAGTKELSLQKADDSVNAYRPLVPTNVEDEEDEGIDYNSYNQDLFPEEPIPTPSISDALRPFIQDTDGRLILYSQEVTQDGEDFISDNVDTSSGVRVYSMKARRSQYATDPSKDLQRFWQEAESSISFEEGTQCIKFGSKQLVAIPEWNDKPSKIYQQVGLGVSVPVVTGGQSTDSHIKLVTWPVMCRYTSWENLYEERDTGIALEKHAGVVIRSAMIYKDAINVDRTVVPSAPKVVFDNVTQPFGPFLSAVDMCEEYFGTPDWTGSVIVSLERGENGWIVPYRVGQKVTFIGEVSPDISSFDGIINRINLSNMDEGVCTLNFGKQISSRSPFSPNRRFRLDPEIEGFTDTNPLAPAVVRL